MQFVRLFFLLVRKQIYNNNNNKPNEKNSNTKYKRKILKIRKSNKTNFFPRSILVEFGAFDVGCCHGKREVPREGASLAGAFCPTRNEQANKKIIKKIMDYH